MHEAILEYGTQSSIRFSRSSVRRGSVEFYTTEVYVSCTLWRIPPLQTKEREKSPRPSPVTFPASQPQISTQILAQRDPLPGMRTARIVRFVSATWRCSAHYARLPIWRHALLMPQQRVAVSIDFHILPACLPNTGPWDFFSWFIIHYTTAVHT